MTYDILSLLPGTQAGIDVPELAPVPPAITNLADEAQRRRAAEVWNAVVRLLGLIHLRQLFFLFADYGHRLTDATDSQIQELYPEVADIGAVLNALAEDKVGRLVSESRTRPDTVPGDTLNPDASMIALVPESRENCFLFQALWDPSDRYRDSNVRWYRGRGLINLIESFQQATKTQLECLIRNPINSPLCQRPAAEVREDLAVLTSYVEIDATGDGPPFPDPMRTLTTPAYLQTWKTLTGELTKLRNLLASFPNTVIAVSKTSDGSARGPGRPESTKKAERDHIIRKLAKTHNLRNKPAKLLVVVQADENIRRIGELVTKDVVRNALDPKRKRAEKRGGNS